jgi:DNA-binding MarR family transcriptional regulator
MKRKHVAPPNYTQVPNWILDELARIKGPDLLILLVICRETFGWHRKRSMMLSLTGLMRRTGMSKPAVIGAVRRLEGVGWILRRTHKRSFTYCLNMALNAREEWVYDDE